MTASIPNQQSGDDSLEPSATSDYERYHWETASQPTTDAAHPDAAFMWDVASQITPTPMRPSGSLADEPASAPTIERDPREAPPSRPRSTSAPLSGPLSASAPLSGPLGGGERPRRRGCVAVAGGCLVALAAVIALCAMSLGVVSALEAVSRPATATTTRVFHVGAAPTLKLASSAAGVQVTGDPNANGVVTVSMTASVKTTSYNAARNIVQAIKLTTTQSGDTITISLIDGNGFALQAFLGPNITLAITTPTHTSISGAVQAGALTAENLTGALTVTDNAGAVNLHHMTFTGASTLRLQAGALLFDGALATGATVDASVNAGSVVAILPRQSGAHLDASATSGSVAVVGWNATITRGVANASTIADVGANPTGSLTIRVNAGSVTVTLL